MNDLDNQPELGLSIEVTGGTAPETFPGNEYMKRYLDAYMAHGGLFSRSQAAGMLGVSPQRIHQLVQSKRLRLVTLSVPTPAGAILIEETIPGNDLTARMEAPRSKGGRGKMAVAQPLEAMAA